MAGQRCRFSPFIKQCFVTLAVGINVIGIGTVMGFPAVLLPQLHQPDSGIRSSKEADSWIASVIGITLLLGSFVVTPIMGRCGRKIAFYTVNVSALVGWMTILLADSVEVILVGRFICGLSNGMMLPLRSILIGEYTSPKNRGGFLSTISLCQVSGAFFVHLIGSLLSWQRTVLVCLFVPFVSLVMALYTPESPSWLVSKGRYEESRNVFRWLRGDEEENELESMIQAKSHLENNVRSRDKSLISTVKNKEFFMPIILVIHLFVIAQITGGPTTAAYATIIIKEIMGPDVNVDVWMLSLDSQRVLVNAIAVYVINKVRRRTMMFATGGLSLASHIAIAAYVYCKSNGMLYYDSIWIPGLLLNLQMFSVSFGTVPLPNVVAGEVFPLEYRSIAGSISLSSTAAYLFLVLKTFPGLVESTGISGTYSVYAGVISYCLVVIWFLMPETKGKTLQEIENKYRGVLDMEERHSLKKSVEKVDCENAKLASS